MYRQERNKLIYRILKRAISVQDREQVIEMLRATGTPQFAQCVRQVSVCSQCVRCVCVRVRMPREGPTFAVRQH